MTCSSESFGGTTAPRNVPNRVTVGAASRLEKLDFILVFVYKKLEFLKALKMIVL